jgi:hypothetical protein
LRAVEDGSRPVVDGVPVFGEGRAVADVPGTGTPRWLAAVLSGWVAACAVTSTGVATGLTAPVTVARSAPTLLVTGVRSEAGTPPRPGSLEVECGAETGRGEASAAPANAAERATPTTTPAAPPPRNRAARHSLLRGRIVVLSESGPMGPGVATRPNIPLTVDR